MGNEAAEATPHPAAGTTPRGRRDDPRRHHELAIAAAVLIVATAPVTVRMVVVFGWAFGTATALISATGLGAAVATRHLHWALRGTPAVLAGIAIMPLGGVQTGAWVTMGIVLATWGVLKSAPVPVLPVSTEAAVPLVVISMVAAWRQLSAWGWWIFLITAGVSVAAILLTARFQHLPRRFGSAVAFAISSLLFGALSIVTVAIPAAAFRLARVDPLHSDGERPGRWIRVRGREVQPERPWTRTTGKRSPADRRRLTTLLVAGTAIVGLVLAVTSWWPTGEGTGRLAYNLTDPAGTPTPATVPAAFSDAEWYPKYLEDIDYASTWLDGFLPIDGLALPDFESAHLNTEGGVRESWAPPACDCRRLTVWVYGASTVFGLGQRDGHTIPSELARIAWDNDIALDVVNRGAPSEQHWQEANRLRWDLTRSEAPDVVVFYDGASDTVGASWLNERRLGDIGRPSQPLTEGFLEMPFVREALDAARPEGEPPPPPANLRGNPTSTVPEMSPEDVGRLATSRFGRARQMSVDISESNGLNTFWFWQPTRLSRPPVEGEPVTDLDETSRRITEAAAASVPDGVVNLSDVLDDELRPMFSDDVHHNEEAAALIAAALFAEMEPTLRRMAAG